MNIKKFYMTDDSKPLMYSNSAHPPAMNAASQPDLLKSSAETDRAHDEGRHTIASTLPVKRTICAPVGQGSGTHHRTPTADDPLGGQRWSKEGDMLESWSGQGSATLDQQIAAVMAVPDDQLDGHLRAIGLDPDECEQAGTRALEGAITSPAFREHLDWCSREVATWPAWKRGGGFDQGSATSGEAHIEAIRVEVESAIHRYCRGTDYVAASRSAAEKIAALAAKAEQSNTPVPRVGGPDDLEKLRADLAWHKESLKRHSEKLAAVWGCLAKMIAEHTGKPCSSEPFEDLAKVFAAPVAERAAAPASVPEHSDDIAVDAFAAAMKARMAEMRGRGRMRGRSGWDNPEKCSLKYLMDQLKAVPLSQPVDIGNYAMMLFNRAIMENEGYPAKAAQPIGEFDAWQKSPYTKALQKSIAEDYIPKASAPEVAQPAAQGEPVMLDGTPLSDHLENTVPESEIGDEWTKGFEECKRRLFRIVGHQLRATPAPTATLSKQEIARLIEQHTGIRKSNAPHEYAELVRLVEAVLCADLAPTAGEPSAETDELCNSALRAEPAGRDGACTACHGENLMCEHCDGMGIEPRKIDHYGDCKCVLSKYCDGECNPVFADQLATRSRAEGGNTSTCEACSGTEVFNGEPCGSCIKATQGGKEQG